MDGRCKIIPNMGIRHFYPGGTGQNTKDESQDLKD